MATIEERAKDFADKGLPNNIEGAIRYTYIYAANEQQKIDVEKACEWFTNYLFDVLGCPDDWCRSGEEEFKKAMEE